MFDLKLLEPTIEIFQPLLIHFGPETAILYGFLKHLVSAQELSLYGTDEDAYYQVYTTRNDIKEATGLSFGKQIDAELNLIFANLAVSCEINDEVGFDFYPQNETSFRRTVNKKRYKWIF